MGILCSLDSRYKLKIFVMPLLSKHTGFTCPGIFASLLLVLVPAFVSSSNVDFVSLQLYTRSLLQNRSRDDPESKQILTARHAVTHT